MCDYSLHAVATRPARVGDKLVTTRFPNTLTHGFSALGEPEVAVCLMPGTELAFERDIEWDAGFVFSSRKSVGERVARFRHVDANPNRHRDALEIPGGYTVLLTRLCEGQHATVLQLPAAPEHEHGAAEQRTAEQPAIPTPGLETVR